MSVLLLVAGFLFVLAQLVSSAQGLLLLLLLRAA